VLQVFRVFIATFTASDENVPDKEATTKTSVAKASEVLEIY
jgi:hypothetical protein